MNVACLLCGKSLESFCVLPKRALLTKPLARPRPDAIADMGLAFCRSCRHLSSRLESSQPVAEFRTQTYEELYRSYAPTGLSPLQQRYTERVADWLSGALTAPSGVLEVGCHDGYLLKRLADRGHRCVGVEPSPFADVARFRYGLEVRREFFRAERFEPASFDLVILRHIVEHVPEPIAFVRDVLRTLRPGGLLYVEVPNSQWSLENAYLPEFHCDHISYFTPASALRLLEIVGASEVMHAETVSAYMRFPFLNILARYVEAPPILARRTGWFWDFRVDDVLERFTTRFERYVRGLRSLDRGGTRLAVWGAGSIGIQFAIDAEWRLEDATYVDPNPANQGLTLAVTGHPVVAPEVLRRIDPSTLLIASGWEEDVKQQARNYVSADSLLVAFADLAGEPT